jgi:hypothetical protein
MFEIMRSLHWAGDQSDYLLASVSPTYSDQFVTFAKAEEVQRNYPAAVQPHYASDRPDFTTRTTGYAAYCQLPAFGRLPAGRFAGQSNTFHGFAALQGSLLLNCSWESSETNQSPTVSPSHQCSSPHSILDTACDCGCTPRGVHSV